MKNPPWSRDELIIALDFYIHHRPLIPSKNSSVIRELSKLLNELQVKLGKEPAPTFRNTNSVYMKLMNFRRFDPAYEGVGLSRGSKDEEEVWNLYFKNPTELSSTVECIRIIVESNNPIVTESAFDEVEVDASEGKVLTGLHRYRERDKKIIKRKKDRVLRETGKLQCEGCSFEFSATYGEHGYGFIECHHIIPLSKLKPGQKTRLVDLCLVCSNCHRMIHRTRPWLSVEQLQQIVRAQEIQVY